MREKTHYTDDFRADAVRLVQRGDRSLNRVASDLGINHWTLRDWYRKAEMAKQSKSPKPSKAAAAPSGETPDQRIQRLERENRELRKRVDTLEMDRAILKKAAAFFAKENE
jgi:transposase